MKKLFLILLLCLIATPAYSAFELGGYNRRQKISINADAYISGNLTDQTVAIHIPSSNTAFWANDDGTGTYVRFTSSDGSTLLKFQVESYDSGGEDAWYHVKIPTLSSSADTDIYVYYDATTPSAGADIPNTWNANYEAVYHLNADQTEGAFDDATGTYDGTDNGTADVAGAIDKARNFVASEADYINIGDVDITGDITLEAMVKIAVDPAGGYDHLIAKYPSGDEVPYALGMVSGTDELRFFLKTSATWYVWTTSTANLTTGWHHVGVTYDETVDPIFYVDGSVATSSQTAGSGTPAMPSDNTNTYIGYYANGSGSHSWDGYIDEVALSSDIRTADYMIARYRSYEGSWVSFASEETAPLSGTIASVATFSADMTGDSAVTATLCQLCTGMYTSYFQHSNDAFIASGDTGTAYGAYTYLLLGQTTTDEENVILMHFDFTTLPSDITITGADLKLYSTDHASQTSDVSFKVYRVGNEDASWKESSVTWASIGGIVAADCKSAVLGTGTATDGSAGWVTSSLDVDVLQKMMDVTYENTTFAIIPDDIATAGYYAQFHSDEYTTDGDLVPQMVVTYVKNATRLTRTQSGFILDEWQQAEDRLLWKEYEQGSVTFISPYATDVDYYEHSMSDGTDWAQKGLMHHGYRRTRNEGFYATLKLRSQAAEAPARFGMAFGMTEEDLSSATTDGYKVWYSGASACGSDCLHLIEVTNRSTHTVIDTGTGVTMDTDLHTIRIAADSTSINGYWDLSGTAEVTSADTTYLTGEYFGVTGDRCSDSSNKCIFRQFQLTRGFDITVNNIPTGYKAKLYDSGDSLIDSATESSGVATIDALTVDYPFTGYIQITDGSDVVIDNGRFPATGNRADFYGGDVYDYSSPGLRADTPTVDSISDITRTTLTVNMTRPENTSDYSQDVLYRCGQSRCDPSLATEVTSWSGSSTSPVTYADTGLSDGTLYHYFICRERTGGVADFCTDPIYTRTDYVRFYPQISLFNPVAPTDIMDQWQPHNQILPTGFNDYTASSTYAFIMGDTVSNRHTNRYSKYTTAQGLQSKPRYDKDSVFEVETVISMTAYDGNPYRFAGLTLYPGEDWYEEITLTSGNCGDTAVEGLQISRWNESVGSPCDELQAETSTKFNNEYKVRLKYEPAVSSGKVTYSICDYTANSACTPAEVYTICGSGCDETDARQATNAPNLFLLNIHAAGGAQLYGRQTFYVRYINVLQGLSTTYGESHHTDWLNMEKVDTKSIGGLTEQLGLDGVATTGTATGKLIQRPTFKTWNEFTMSVDERSDSANKIVLVKFYDESDVLIPDGKLPDNSTGFRDTDMPLDLTGIVGVGLMKVVATLSTDDAGVSPYLLDMAIDFIDGANAGTIPMMIDLNNFKLEGLK